MSSVYALNASKKSGNDLFSQLSGLSKKSFFNKSRNLINDCLSVTLKSLSLSFIKLAITVALGDVVEFEKLPPGTDAWFCTKDKYNLPMFSYVCQAETKAK
jgi:hypothetical protein